MFHRFTLDEKQFAFVMRLFKGARMLSCGLVTVGVP
jgi:hypothetical protein